MSIRSLIILSQLNPPAQRSRVLHRPRIMDQLKESVNYPLTIIEAGTGFGKSTAVLSFIETVSMPVTWYTISGTDRDPKLFLAKLFTAFNQQGQNTGEEALRILDMADATPREAMIAFLNALSKDLQEESLFILDDFNRVTDVGEIMEHVDWLIDNLPPRLHVSIATRYTLSLPSMNKWRVKNGLQEIHKEDLSFTKDEIDQLFTTQYGITLTSDEITQLLKKTEGWAIGLQMVWQILQNNPDLSLHEVLEDERLSRTALFDYLADEVLTRLSPEYQHFLLHTAILSKMDSATCDFLLNRDDSDQVLNHLHTSGLFIEELRPGVYRYHAIFREFLLNRLKQESTDIRLLHRKVASYFRAHEYWEETLFHLLSAEDYQEINQILESIGEKMIRDGRHESINYWINAIPESVRQQFPYILFLSGEVNRYLGHFALALEYYHTAERLYRKRKDNWGISKALRGQAQVFLDTIRPVNADQLLQDALKLLDPVEMPDEVANLLVLTAENQLNLGLPDSAEELLAQASQLRSNLDMETDFIQARIFLRTGRLHQGISLLENRESIRPVPPFSRPQRFHRESSLLLSLFYAILGETDAADKYARQGIEIGKLLKSTFVQSVGYMRLGHALQLRSQNPFNTQGFDKALAYYHESMEKVDVTRIHVEPLWGICRALGYSQRILEAEQTAMESLSIAKNAGDEWISILIELSLGAGQVISGQFEAAQHHLTNAETASLEVRDPFTLCVARMWLAIKAWAQGFQNTAFGYLEKFIPILQENEYTFLLTRETFLGLKDREMVYPLLMAAVQNDIEKDVILALLESRGLATDRFHPGYSLWVRLLGGFEVWRGSDTHPIQDWKREKAKHLFQLLAANREKWLHRDQINAILWADTTVENAANYLKVVFNTLNQVLEPNRPRGEAPFFIERQQERYRLNPSARIIVDADLFIEESGRDSLAALENAVKLYQGAYFADCFMQEWLTIEEQYYRQQFLRSAERLCKWLISENQLEKALEISYKILGEDPLAESIYCLQMIIFHEMGRDSMVRSVFKHCQETFQNELQSSVSEETRQLFQELLAEDNVLPGKPAL
jgi:LuxR family transcriptional regulator, maltose regulon positive regulatory protein